MSSAPAPADPELIRAFADVVGELHVLTEPDVVASYAVDWTGRFQGVTPAVVRPGTVEEVAQVVALCRSHGVAVVTQGGNTGMVGGGVPLHGEVVMSLRRLSALGPVDASAGQLTAQAGVTLSEVQAAARDAGWSYGVDLGGRDSATIGGNVATNAGGLRVLRYGDTRAQLLGVQAVLGTCDVVEHLGGLLKDNTGYALHALLCGSEGTLGAVTAVRLRLVPPAPSRVAAILGMKDAGSAVVAAQELRRTLPTLSAVELMLRAGVELVCRVLGMPLPLAAAHDAYLLVEASAQVDPTVDLTDAVSALAGMQDAAVAVDPQRIAALFRYREGHTEAVNSLGAPPHKLDVTLPHDVLAQVVDRLPSVVEAVAPTASVWLFGHVGDGNVHVNVTGVAPDDERVDDAVFRAVAEAGGSISAEHGIGTAKRRWLDLNRSPAELRSFAAIKHALDPDGILNPHVLVGAV
ncbi:MAG TPA: FAD-binding oxidoreductase [Acidimicrobiales bacterium]|nr:FAD-binding oxidoreductase [Acidimicrobiales bacterium]